LRLDLLLVEFAENYIDRLNNNIEKEQKLAEEEETLSKHHYGEDDR